MTAGTSPRVVSELAAGKEGNHRHEQSRTLHLHSSSQYIRNANYSWLRRTGEVLSFDSVCHVFPGIVDTGIMDRTCDHFGNLGLTGNTTASRELILTNSPGGGEEFCVPGNERQVPPCKARGRQSGGGSSERCRSCEELRSEERGATVSILGENGESTAHSAVLAGYRQDKLDERIWENIEAVWKRALESCCNGWVWSALGRIIALDTGTTSRASDAISSRLPFRSCGRTGLLEFSESTIDDPSMSPIYCSLLDTCINGQLLK